MNQLTVKQIKVIKTAMKEYYEKQYKMYKMNNELPVTDVEFEALKKKTEDLRDIKIILETVDNEVKTRDVKEVVEDVTQNDENSK